MRFKWGLLSSDTTTLGGGLSRIMELRLLVVCDDFICGGRLGIMSTEALSGGKEVSGYRGQIFYRSLGKQNVSSPCLSSFIYLSSYFLATVG
jgi:hypothetical protein